MAKRSTAIDRQETFLRRVELKRAPVNGHPSPWLFKAAGYGQLLTVPVIIGYFVFYVDHGEKENVFSEPKRWLERQKAALMGLPPPTQNIPPPNSNPT